MRWPLVRIIRRPFRDGWNWLGLDEASASTTPCLERKFTSSERVVVFASNLAIVHITTRTATPSRTCYDRKRNIRHTTGSFGKHPVIASPLEYISPCDSLLPTAYISRPTCPLQPHHHHHQTYLTCTSETEILAIPSLPKNHSLQIRKLPHPNQKTLRNHPIKINGCTSHPPYIRNKNSALTAFLSFLN